MFVILAYAPILMGLPLLLLGGVVFVVVPGGFIIVLGALYYAAVGLTGLLGLAASGRSRDRASRARRTNTGFENASRSGRSSLGPRGAMMARRWSRVMLTLFAVGVIAGSLMVISVNA